MGSKLYGLGVFVIGRWWLKLNAGVEGYGEVNLVKDEEGATLGTTGFSVDGRGVDVLLYPGVIRGRAGVASACVSRVTSRISMIRTLTSFWSRFLRKYLWKREDNT